MTFILVDPCGVIEWKVGIPHDGNGSVWWSFVDIDHQVVHIFDENMWGVEIVPFYFVQRVERPERPVGLQHFETKKCGQVRCRVVLPAKPPSQRCTF